MIGLEPNDRIAARPVLSCIYLLWQMPWPAASLAGAFPSLGVVLTVHSYSLAIPPRLAAAKWRVIFGEITYLLEILLIADLIAAICLSSDS